MYQSKKEKRTQGVPSVTKQSPPSPNEQPSETAPEQEAFQKQITEQQDQHGFHGSCRMAKSVLSVRSDRRIAGSADKETTFRRVWYATAGAGRLWPESNKPNVRLESGNGISGNHRFLCYERSTP